mmetsp:Transcript_93104/g.240604  ORF Transcript_93104/g.240604 Transcript_93104/m.240604 type:complete len:340 (+) Transcript_93104:1127-2146(+)
MVANGVPGLVAVVGRVALLHCWQQGLNLHHIMDRCEREKSHEPRRVHRQLSVLLVPDEQLCRYEEVLELAPEAIAVECQPLVGWIEALIAVLWAQRLPVLVDAEGEALLPVDVQPHEPVNAEERAYGALILVTDGAARACLRAPRAPQARRHNVAVEEVQVELGEGRQAHVVVAKGVVRVGDAARHALHGRPGSRAPLLRHAQRGAGRQVDGGVLAGPLLQAQQRRARERGDRRPLDGHGPAGVGAPPRPEVHLRSQDARLRCAASACPILCGKLLAVREADAPHTCILGVHHAKDHRVDAVQRVQARVGAASDVVLDVEGPEHDVLHEVLFLPLDGEP